MWAAARGKTDFVCFFLKFKDIEVNLQNKRGYTALIWASTGGNIEVVRILLERHDIKLDLRSSALIEYSDYHNDVSLPPVTVSEERTALMWATL
jgi:ankyrin repeat protein